VYKVEGMGELQENSGEKKNRGVGGGGEKERLLVGGHKILIG